MATTCPAKSTVSSSFFLEDGKPINDPEITRWRWSESIKALNIRRRGPYRASQCPTRVLRFPLSTQRKIACNRL